MDLGANEFVTFRKVTFPLIAPAMLAAALLGFALSIDDFVITYFNAGSTQTFPVFVWGTLACPAASDQRRRERHLHRGDRDRPRQRLLAVPERQKTKGPHDDNPPRSPAARPRPPLAALHAHGRLPAGRGADHRARRRLLPRGRRTGSATSTRSPGSSRSTSATASARRSARRRSRRCGSCPSTPTGRTRTRARSSSPRRWLARARRPEPRLLRLRRLGGGRVGMEAGAPVLPRPRRQAHPGSTAAEGEMRHDERVAAPAAAQAQGDRPRRSPTTGRRWAPSRSTASPRCARRSSRSSPRCATCGTRTATTARPRRPRRSSRSSCSTTSSRRSVHGPRDGLPRAHGAGAERRRLLHAPGRLLAGRARDLRRARHPALGRRGDHRLRPRWATGSAPSATTSGRTSSARQGPVLVVRVDRRGDRHRPRDGAVPRGDAPCTRTGSPSAATRSCRRSR